MSNRDALVSDVTIVLYAAYAEAPRMDETLKRLSSMGLNIRDVDRDNGVVEGTINHDKIAAVKSLEGVDYVRVVFTYIADYPVGDPRDVAASAT